MCICYWCCVKLLIELGFDMADLFVIFENIFKNFFFKKVHYFCVCGLFVVVYCGFGELGVYLVFMGVYLLFVFCFGGFFELFLVLRSALSTLFCIVVIISSKAHYYIFGSYCSLGPILGYVCPYIGFCLAKETLDLNAMPLVFQILPFAWKLTVL